MSKAGTQTTYNCFLSQLKPNNYLQPKVKSICFSHRNIFTNHHHHSIDKSLPYEGLIYDYATLQAYHYYSRTQKVLITFTP